MLSHHFKHSILPSRTRFSMRTLSFKTTERRGTRLSEVVLAMVEVEEVEVRQLQPRT
jgi:hypothetical protein